MPSQRERKQEREKRAQESDTDTETHINAYELADWFHDQRAHKLTDIHHQGDGSNEVLQKKKEANARRFHKHDSVLLRKKHSKTTQMSSEGIPEGLPWATAGRLSDTWTCRFGIG